MTDKVENITNVIFDLDGTVIDSYPGIQFSFDEAYKKLYNISCPHNIRSLVGPPINDIFAKISGETDLDKLVAFVKFFQESYDAGNYKLCNLYEGVEELFKDLLQKGINLYIATNKRLKPTELILTELNIRTSFKAVYCIDSVMPKYNDKVEMIVALLKNENLNAKKTLLVGDTHHDQLAAERNNIKFIYAEYGFGNLSNMQYSINHTSNILNYIN